MCIRDSANRIGIMVAAHIDQRRAFGLAIRQMIQNRLMRGIPVGKQRIADIQNIADQ